jgi:acyl-homoserine lactone acylase PvdQ
MSRLRTVLLAAAALAGASPATAAARDFAATARAVIPSGQSGSVPPGPDAARQALMYDALTARFDRVRPEDLLADFKSERFGVGPDGPGVAEAVPRGGVRIVRDAFEVPHITGRTHDDVTWALGWVAQEDRGLLLAQARYPARLAALDVPVNAFGLVRSLTPFRSSARADAIVRRNGLAALRRAGRDGRGLLHDIDVYVAGLNARLRHDGSTQAPWTRTDVFAANALLGQLFGEGGGREAGWAQLRSALVGRLGAGRAARVFADLAQHEDRDSPSTLTRAFPFGSVPGHPTGNTGVDAGSLRPVDPGGLVTASAASAPAHRLASNFLLVGARRSRTGHPLFVAGPQIGYSYPGLTFEADVRGPGFEARGASAPGFPGTVLIGRGPDFAWSLTSARSDLVDTFAERLCGGSRTRYRYRGRCREMGRIDAGVLGDGRHVVYRTTVHGPVTGYARSHGRPIALARKRSSYGRDILFQLPFRDLTLNRVRSVATFDRAFSRSPFTFNAAYADDRHIAMYSAGRIPVRDPRVDPRLPTTGTGAYEWRGFLPAARHPHQADPPGGVLVNWNNRPAPGWAAADDNPSWGSVQRVQLLRRGLERRRRHDLPSVVSAMNAAATQDLRNVALTPDLARLLRGHRAPSARAARMLALLERWRRQGSSRLDRDLDGTADAGAPPAIWDALDPRLLRAVMGRVLGPQLEQLGFLGSLDAGPASDFTGGGFWWVDEDLRRLTGTRFRTPLRVRYCGAGHRAACARAVWRAMDATGQALAAAQGTPDPARWRADTDRERITFAPGLLPVTIRYTNRPSGIQQVVSFREHR